MDEVESWASIVISRSFIQEIGYILLFKAVALALLYLLFFDKSHRPVVTPSNMAGFLFENHSLLNQ